MASSSSCSVNGSSVALMASSRPPRLVGSSQFVSRELAIPGVVGTRDATSVIADGARVRVDGASGEVQVLS